MTSRPAQSLESTFRHVLVQVAGEALYVTMHRPAARNALNRSAHRELDRVFDAFAADDTLRVAVIRGAGGKAFCPGSDLKEKRDRSSDEYPPGGFAGLTHRFDLDKPVVAAVNGHALGGGLEIVLACDLAVAVEHAEFGFPEPLVGLAALSGGVHRLVRQIPYKPAMGLLLTGGRIDARAALGLGLVNEVAPASDFESAVDRWVTQVLRCAPLALQATKQVARRSLEENSLAAAIRREYPAVAGMLASRDALEGPRAFAEKRSPRWTGH